MASTTTERGAMSSTVAAPVLIATLTRGARRRGHARDVERERAVDAGGDPGGGALERAVEAGDLDHGVVAVARRSERQRPFATPIVRSPLVAPMPVVVANVNSPRSAIPAKAIVERAP